MSWYTRVGLRKADDGFFLQAKPDEYSAKEIHDWLVANGIPNPVAAGELHVTIMASPVTPKPVPTELGTGYHEVKCGTCRWSRMGEEANALVILFDSPSIEARWADLVRAGAQPTWSMPKPHMTVSYDAGDFDPTKIPLPEAWAFGLREVAPEPFRPTVRKADLLQRLFG